MIANAGAFEALPAGHKAALQVACAEADADMLARYDNLNPQALRRLVAAGAQLRFWPREILQAAWRETHALYDDMSGGNERFRRIWTAYRAYRDDEYQWFRVAENSYDNFAYPAAAQRT